MKFALALIFGASPLLASLQYTQILNQYPDFLGRTGSWKQGEIEIATSPSEIKRIEKHCAQRYQRMGYSKEEAELYSRVGIITEDHYWIWVRDAVTFPGGIPGVYDRIIMKSGVDGPPCVVVLPKLKNGKVLLNVNFRHATRSWEIELPRGNRNAKESALDTARRELKEETGCLASKMISLGSMAPATGVIAGVVPIFYCEIKAKHPRHQDESEAIALNIEMSIDEIQEAFLKGYAVIKIRGKETKVYCRDPYLSYAVLQAVWRKLI